MIYIKKIFRATAFLFLRNFRFFCFFFILGSTYHLLISKPFPPKPTSKINEVVNPTDSLIAETLTSLEDLLNISNCIESKKLIQNFSLEKLIDPNSQIVISLDTSNADLKKAKILLKDYQTLCK